MLTSECRRLIHPSRLRSTIRLVVVIRGDVVAVFVEGDFTVVIAHVDFEFPGGPLTLPAIVGVAQSEIFFRSGKTNSALGQEFQIEESEQRPAQASEVGHSALRR